MSHKINIHDPLPWTRLSRFTASDVRNQMCQTQMVETHVSCQGTLCVCVCLVTLREETFNTTGPTVKTLLSKPTRRKTHVISTCACFPLIHPNDEKCQLVNGSIKKSQFLLLPLLKFQCA